jgi:hypothetical protein
MSTGDLMACRVWTQLNDQAAVNTLNYEVIATSGGAVTDQDLCDHVDTLVHSYYTNTMTVDCQYHGVQTYFLQRPSGTLPSPVKNVSHAGPGLGSAPVMPTQVAAIMRTLTNVRGPGGRGRLYLPFLDSALATADGQQVPSLVLAINTLATSLLGAQILTNGGSTATVVWCLVHKPRRPAMMTALPIQQAASTGKFGTMRKRGDYGRQNSSPI